MGQKIRVLVAEEESAISEQIQQLIAAQADMELAGVATSMEEIFALTEQDPPEVLLLDLNMPGSGLRALEQVAESRPGLRVIVLATHEETTLLRSVLAFGSLGYVVHKSNERDLLSSIRKICSGRSYIDVPTGGLQLPPGLDPHSPRFEEVRGKLGQLSKRESEVLEAVAFGYTNREIAERIGVSVKSVETYRYRVAEKLGFKSRADLVRFSLEAGLLQVGKEVFD